MITCLGRSGLYEMVMSFYVSVNLSPVKFVKSFLTRQQLAASGGLSYRLRVSDAFVL